jgi:isopentenyldiphosphate isomerase
MMAAALVKRVAEYSALRRGWQIIITYTYYLSRCWRSALGTGWKATAVRARLQVCSGKKCLADGPAIRKGRFSRGQPIAAGWFFAFIYRRHVKRMLQISSGGFWSFMPEEIFDVVNEWDEVIDRRPRSEVHRLDLKHRAVHVLVFNARGELFLQKRSLRKDTHPGVWDSSASGHLDAGETYDACAVRELGEEIGLFIGQPPVRLFKVDARPETGQEFVWVYRCDAEGPFTLHPDEIDEGGWFAPAALNEWLGRRPEEFAPAFALIWGLAIEKSLLPLGG